MAVKVRQRKGKWWILIDHKGKRKAKCVGDSQRTARLFAEKMEAALLLGQFDLSKAEPRRPFDNYFTHWLETYAKAHCKESAIDRYRRTFRLYLLPALKHKDLGAISRDDVKKLVYGLVSAGKSRNSVRAALTPLIEMFNHAVEDGHIAVNPAMRVLKRVHTEGTSRKGKADFLTREELGLLLQTCQEHFPDYYPFVLLLARTGLRLGEAIAIQWGDIDMHGRFIEVKRACSGPLLSTPKNGKPRRVDMSQQLTATLKAVLVERKTTTLRKGWSDVPAWVFISKEGTPYNRGNFRWRIWYKLLEKAGLRRIRIHDLRHTFASLLIQNGESLVYVKEQMGHYSIQLTVDTYGHLIPGGNTAALDRLDGLEQATFRDPDATEAQNEISVISLVS
jgi:integrase